MSDTDIVEHFTRFAAERRKMPKHGDVILGMHSGTGREIDLTLADLERAAAEIAALRAALFECAHALERRIIDNYAPRVRTDVYETAMAPVLRARALLEPSDTERETTS